MPEFAEIAESISASDLVRSIRFCIAAEFEAIQIYTQIAEKTDNEVAKKILLSIADEEKVHVGEFLRVLSLVAPDEAAFYKKGHEEAEEILGIEETTDADDTQEPDEMIEIEG